MTGIRERQGWRRIAVDIRPLRHDAYRRMWIGSAFSFYGFQFTAVAVPVEMFALTHDSFWVGLLGIASLVPLLIFALWGGAIADAVDRRKLLLVSSCVTWSVTLALLVQALAGVRSPHLLLVLVAIQSMGVAVSMPARQAIVPRLVEPAEVPAANTLNFTMNNGTMVLGPLSAGVVFAIWRPAVGLPIAYAVDALLFTVTLWATYRLPPLPPENGGSKAVGLRSIIDGLRFLATTPVLILSFVIDIVAMVLAMPRALFPEVAEVRFGGGAAIGWLYSAIAIGSVVGGVTSGWIGRVRRQGRALVAAVVGWGLAVAAAGLARQLWLMVVLLAVGGCADLISAVYRQTMLQLNAPDALRGRLQGVFTAVVAGGPRLGD
ncbi:MAG TPA: MFS transporter, partial [Micromonosporaceae bacterium]|nr:MFS transporter [Micromonosporaceae bacterium]